MNQWAFRTTHMGDTTVGQVSLWGRGQGGHSDFKGQIKNVKS